MKKLAWGCVFLCIVSGASFAADPDPAGPSGTAGGASKGVGAGGGGISTNTAIVITATAITVATGAVLAAIVSSSGGTTPTTRH